MKLRILHLDDNPDDQALVRMARTWPEESAGG